MALGTPISQIEALFGAHIHAETAMMAVKGLPEAAGEQTTYILAAEEVHYVPEELVEPVSAILAGVDLFGVGDLIPSLEDKTMSQKNIWELLDLLLPEELLGLDLTPGVKVGGEKKGRVLYDNVWIENGKVKTIRKGEPRTLGYTPRFAKKKYRTRRRRKRLTKRDMYILEVLKTNPQAGALALML